MSSIMNRSLTIIGAVKFLQLWRLYALIPQKRLERIIKSILNVITLAIILLTWNTTNLNWKLYHIRFILLILPH